MLKKINITFLTVLLTITNVQAYTLVIFTDEQNVDKAKGEIEVFKTYYPFNKFDINFKIARVKKEQLACGHFSNNERLLTCPDMKEKLDKAAAKLGGDDVLAIKEHHLTGGGSTLFESDHTVPAITTKSVQGTLLHEYMHKLGFVDEYVLEAGEAAVYCDLSSTALNLAKISPKDSYENDNDARNEHSDEIPWYNHILPITLITSSNQKKLGTEVKIVRNYFNNSSVIYQQTEAEINRSYDPSFNGEIGLFPADSCRKWSNEVERKKLWSPSTISNIMKNTKHGIGALEGLVEDALLAKGVKYKEGFGKSTKIILPSYEVNDSGRMVVKPQSMPPAGKEISGKSTTK